MQALVLFCFFLNNVKKPGRQDLASLSAWIKRQELRSSAAHLFSAVGDVMTFI